MEARTPRSQYWQGWFLSESLETDLFFPFLLSSGHLLAIFGVLWLIDALSQFLSSSSQGILLM